MVKTAMVKIGNSEYGSG